MIALFVGANANAQIDFETSLTEPESYNNGSEGSEGFDFSPIQLVNYYDSELFKLLLSRINDTKKPFLYAAMLDSGDLLPNTLIADVPTQYGSYSPVNFNKFSSLIWSINDISCVSIKLVKCGKLL